MSTNSKHIPASFPQSDGIRSQVTERFIYVQKLLKLSGADVARGSGLTRSYISRVVTGKVNVGVDLMLYLAREHSISMNWFLLGRGDVMQNAKPLANQEFLASKVQDLQNEVQHLREEMSSYTKSVPKKK